jgi:dihydrofolate reductase
VRRLIVTEFVSLDGVMEAPGGEPTHPHAGWVFDFMGEEQQRYKLEETLEAESLLLGRVTYDGFSAAWPERDGEFADKMNAMPKHVVSSTLTAPEWNNTEVISLDDVPGLKEGAGGPILVGGSCTLVHALLGEGLIDGLRLMVFPVTLGSGKRVFPSDSPAKSVFKLADSRAFETGVVVLTYERAGA